MAVVRDDPYEGSNLLVDIGTGDHVGFSEVVLPRADVEDVEYRTGGDPARPRHLPGRVTHMPVVLRRGVTGALDLFDWFRRVRDGEDGVERTVTITLLDEDHEPVLTWRLLRAFPVGYGFTDLDAAEEEVLLEEVELAYDGFEME